MNLLECFVSKITSEPYFKYDKWCIDVDYSCWCVGSNTTLMFESKEQCETIEIGYCFLN